MARGPERALSDGDVVTDQVELCVARTGKQHFLRIGDRDFASRDVEPLSFALAWHLSDYNRT